MYVGGKIVLIIEKGGRVKKIIVFLIIISMLFLICGCSKIASGLSGTIEESKEAGTKKLETTSDMPSGFPETVPINSHADITESAEETNNGLASYYIHMEYKGEIKQLSDWYEQELPKNWQVDSVSSGDYDDWSEFYVDAQDSQYYLSVYLYQDAESDLVTVDINVDEKTGAAEEEEEATAEEETAEEETAGSEVAYSGELEDAEIAFICASVGYAWNIGEHFPDLSIAVYDEYQFDKGDIIRNVLGSGKPDIMIIKECAAYFPPENNGSSMEAYKNLIRDWVNLCRGEGVIPVLTTVVPVDPYNPENLEEQLDSLLEFNDWIHEYCQYEEISVLDLEAALRTSEGDRTLNPDYDSGDGLHPNDLAYSEKLDYILIPALEEALDIGY